MVKSIIPEPYLASGDQKYNEGDRVRVICYNKNSYIGVIGLIDEIHVTLEIGTMDISRIKVEDIEKIRIAADDETFDTVPYFDDEEAEFWRTHWIKNGKIVERTKGGE